MAFIQSEIKDGVARLRIDHGKPNSIAQAVSEELIAALDEASRSDEVKAVVLFGKPGMFSGGFDLPTMREGPRAAREMVKAGGRLLANILDHPKPIVAGCAGHAVAMGSFMVMACDERIGARGDFKLGMNETAIGMTLPIFGIELARAKLSKRHYERAIVHSTMYDPQGALEVGILDRLVEPESLEAEAIAAATRLGELHQPSFRNNKRQARGDLAERILSTLDENMSRLMPD